MANEEQDFARIMRLLREGLPELAAQIEDEIRAGRSIYQERLPRRAGREDETVIIQEVMSQAVAGTSEPSAPRAAEGDITVRPYSGSEKLDLVREALLTLTYTMDASRWTLHELATTYDTAMNVQFSDPAEVSSLRVDLETEMAQTRATLEAVTRLLGDDMPENER